MRENLSPETLRKMSEAASKRVGELNPFYGRHHSDETKRILSEYRSRRTYMYDKTGNFIKEFRSAKCAAAETGICVAAIRNCSAGKTRTAGGYMWKYADLLDVDYIK